LTSTPPCSSGAGGGGLPSGGTGGATGGSGELLVYNGPFSLKLYKKHFIFFSNEPGVVFVKECDRSL